MGFWMRILQYGLAAGMLGAAGYVLFKAPVWSATHDCAPHPKYTVRVCFVRLIGHPQPGGVFEPVLKKHGLMAGDEVPLLLYASTLLKESAEMRARVTRTAPAGAWRAENVNIFEGMK